MQFSHIIMLAVIAFLIVLCVIYYKEILNYLKGKFFKKKKPQNVEKPKEEKKPTFTVEDFKPLVKNEQEMTRDSSLDELFSDDEFLFDNEFSDLIPNNQETNIPSSPSFNESNASPNFSFDKEFADFNEMFGSSVRKSKNKNLSEKIKGLPPEIKALLIDNVLKKRDDV